MSWRRDDLVAKARLFLRRALDAQGDSALYPFWATLALEQYVRAVLSSVSPALLAEDGDSVMFVFGLAPSGKSISFKVALARCQRVMPTLSKADADFALAMLERRNAELHTGEPAFEGLDRGVWEHRMLRLISQLHDQLGESIAQSVGEELAHVVLAIVKADRELVEGEVKKRISICRNHFELKDPSEIGALRLVAAEQLTDVSHRRVPCPACQSSALVQGHSQLVRRPVLRDEELVVETVWLPFDLNCLCCGLHLRGDSELAAGGQLGTFSTFDRFDAMEHYGMQYAELVAADEYADRFDD